MASIDHLNELLTRAGELLDEAARELSDLELNQELNVKKVGEALANIFEVRLQIFEQRPDLKPGYLKK